LPEFRRRGVFKALYAVVRGLARMANGVVGLRLYVEHHNANAMATYRAMGMKDAGYSVMEEMFADSSS
jgi:ribosomal protein S18 acetylase RimI-like enzyme